MFNELHKFRVYRYNCLDGRDNIVICQAFCFLKGSFMLKKLDEWNKQLGGGSQSNFQSIYILKQLIQLVIIKSLLQYMNQQQQQCKTIEVKPLPKKELSPSKIRNRRYKKLIELRADGFFSEDSIKLRHPFLYHNYLGSNSQRATPIYDNNCTLSQFLQKNLINLEYKQRLAQHLEQHMQDECKEKRQIDENWQVLEECSGEIIMEKGGVKQQGNKVKEWEVVQEEQIELQEQNLIDHAEQLFLQGKVDKAYVNYSEIDNCSDYDSIKEENRDQQEKYFFEAGEEEDERINREHYNGIQDY